MTPTQIAWTGGGAVVVAAVGLAVTLFLQSSPSYQPKSQPVSAPSAVPSPSSPASAGATVYARSSPVEIKIPSIGVDAKIMQVYDNGPGNTLMPPPLTGPQANYAGWWAGVPGNPQKSYSPGQQGPAVLVGHINSSAIGDLIFAKLTSLKINDTATVILADGQQVTFRMDRAEQEISKAEWNSGDALAAQTTQAVYGPSSVPSLRLITCGGAFDQSTGHYVDNVIAYFTEA